MSGGVLPPTLAGPGFHCNTSSSLERISCLHLGSGQGYSTAATPWVFWWRGQHVATGPACVISLKREPLLHCPDSKQLQCSNSLHCWHQLSHFDWQRWGSACVSGPLQGWSTDHIHWRGDDELREVAGGVFSTSMAGLRGDVCSRPNREWDRISLRNQLCLAQLFQSVVSKHSVQPYSLEDSCPRARGSISNHRGPDVSPSKSWGRWGPWHTVQSNWGTTVVWCIL